MVLSYISEYYSAAAARPDFGTRRRSELFDALLALFLAEGFAHLTLDDLAAGLRCSKATLYTLAGSKEQLVRAATVHFFGRATDEVEAQVSEVTGARDRVTAYLTAVGTALTAASDRFMADLDAFGPGRRVYEHNTAIAARRVEELIADGVVAGVFRDVHRRVRRRPGGRRHGPHPAGPGARRHRA